MPHRPNAEELEEFLSRAVSQVVVREVLAALLRSGERRLRIKQGFDPTMPDLHLGHAVGLRKLRTLARWGHEIVLIIGDYTTQIGDPTDKDVTRPLIDHEQVLANARTYQEQFHRIVPRENTRVVFQTEWYELFTLKDTFRLAARFTVQQLLAREEFRKRQTAGTPIPVKDLLYPLLQAYDSVAIEADVEFGGTDQLFNILAGRELLADLGKPPQHAFIVELLEGTDGEKMSKTKRATAIWLTDPPAEMFGKAMSIPDTLMPHYFEWGTEMPWPEVRSTLEALGRGDLHPREAKERLARRIVTELHSAAAAEEAALAFREQVRRGSRPMVITGKVASVQKPGTSTATGIVVDPHTDMGTQWTYMELTGIAGETLSVIEAATRLGLARNRAEMKKHIADGVVELDDQTADVSTNIPRGGRHRLRVGKRFIEFSWR